MHFQNETKQTTNKTNPRDQIEIETMIENENNTDREIENENETDLGS